MVPYYYEMKIEVITNLYTYFIYTTLNRYFEFLEKLEVYNIARNFR